MDSTQRPLAVVTGASSGIGLELARQFAQNGFDVLITAEDDGLAATVGPLEALGARVTTVQADLRTADGVDGLYRQIQAASRPVEAIALNAGVGAGGAFVDNDLEDELDIVALNVASTVHLAKHVVRDMVAQGRGRVLITASIVSVIPGAFSAVYNASKAFLLSFSQAIREELADTGVTVTALMPGATDTEFFERADMMDTKAATGPKDDPADVARDGFEALMSGDDHVVAGAFKNTVLATVANVTPDTALAHLHRKLAEPGSADE